MELKVSNQGSRGLSPPDCVGDPEEQEVSDEDDDDRNHKHRRRETRSLSLERDQPEQFSSRLYRKSSKPFENGHYFRQGDLQSHHNLDREFLMKFEKRRPSAANFSRFSSDLNQRFNINHPFSGDLGFGRGRARDSSSWCQRDSRFTAVDVASSLGQPGSIPPVMFAGRGLHNASNPQNASWGGGFGLLPGIPNVGVDTIHPFGLQGSLGPPLNPSINMAILRQRCRDFEERGFCLQGDMCPMEHGVNRIVVEDVQSLSQFNLPISSAHVLGPAGSGVVPSDDISSSALISSNGLRGRLGTSSGNDDGYTLDGALSSAVEASGADVYDPDQPLWNSNCHEISTGLLALQPPNIDETEYFVDADPSDRMVRSSGAAVGLQSTSSSVWGRIKSSKNRLRLRDKANYRINSTEFQGSRTKEKNEAPDRRASHPGKQANAADLVDSSSKPQTNSGRNVKKPALKALKTLFISGIPLKDNKRDALLSHFGKFGEVIDIYIPSNTERAFVQFSKRDEAERALKSPDAVMGNRFIKLWWANRDNIVDDSTAGGSNMPVMPHHKAEASVTAHSAVANKSKDNIQFTASKVNVVHASDSPRVVSEAKHQTSIGPKAPPPVQKKDSLENLKEELRKKQETLEQKRNEFRQKLDKLQKQATGVKGEVPSPVPAAKKQKLESPVDSAKGGTPKSTESCVVGAQSLAVWHDPRASTMEPSSSKQGARQFGHFVGPFSINRYKLDNRPTSFRVHAPLPADFANVSALRDHFASFGDLSNVELEDLEVQNSHDDDAKSSETSNNVSACVSFKTRDAAEWAFMNGKTWNDHILKFTWITTSSNSTFSQKENSPIPKGPSGTEVQSTEKPATSNPHDNSNGRESSASAMKEASGVDIQSQDKSECDASQDSCVGSENSPVIAGVWAGEPRSEDKSASSSPQDKNGPRPRVDCEVAEDLGEGTNQQMELDENFELIAALVEGE